MNFSLCTLLCLVAAGCSDDIPTPYGQRNAPSAPHSVNGTAVLGEMLEQAGHQVSSRRMLTPRLYEKADCIVWFPDAFAPPSQEVCAWLQDWLFERPGRTLIYVGRDYDAATRYWESILPDAPPEQQKEIRRRLAEAKREFQAAQALAPRSADCEFFTLEGAGRPRRVRALTGDPQWLEGVDPTKAEIELDGRLKPSAEAEVLLASEGDALVARQAWYESQVIVVANGSFLLNLPLVNHEHRKLAGQLIEEVGPPARNVVFLESGPANPPVMADEPALKIPTGMELFHEYPANWILLHLSIVGILFCFWRFPIFGRPFTPQPEGISDFGRHIDALGDLLRQSRDRAYAMTRILHYQQSAGGKEG